MWHLRGLALTRGARVALIFCLLLAADAGQAQSCALCYTQAASASHRLIQGLRTGILVLIVPPMFMSLGITLLAYKKRNRTNERRDSAQSGSDW